MVQKMLLEVIIESMHREFMKAKRRLISQFEMSGTNCLVVSSTDIVYEVSSLGRDHVFDFSGVGHIEIISNGGKDVNYYSVTLA